MTAHPMENVVRVPIILAPFEQLCEDIPHTNSEYSLWWSMSIEKY